MIYFLCASLFFLYVVCSLQKSGDIIVWRIYETANKNKFSFVFFASTDLFLGRSKNLINVWCLFHHTADVGDFYGDGGRVCRKVWNFLKITNYKFIVFFESETWNKTAPSQKASDKTLSDITWVKCHVDVQFEVDHIRLIWCWILLAGSRMQQWNTPPNINNREVSKADDDWK